MVTLDIYSKTQMDAKLHLLTTTGATPELSVDTGKIKVADNAAGYDLYHVSFKDINLDKYF